jgi:hypothetical protein
VSANSSQSEVELQIICPALPSCLAIVEQDDLDPYHGARYIGKASSHKENSITRKTKMSEQASLRPIRRSVGIIALSP